MPNYEGRKLQAQAKKQSSIPLLWLTSQNEEIRLDFLLNFFTFENIL